MKAIKNNLLVRIHKWADDENFMTESLVHLIEYLRENEPIVASELIRRITSGAINETAEGIGALEIRTQVHHGDAIPDIELETSQHFVIVEVKSGHHITANQRQKYPEILKRSGKPGDLIFLTRHADSAPGEKNIRWFEVADWIKVESARISNETSRFLVNQFLDFLKARRMTMEKVTWHLTEGVLSLQNLLDMMGKTAQALKPDFKMYRQYNGVGFFLDGKKFWWGILLDNPNEMQFSTHVDFRMDIQKAQELKKGELVEAKKWHVDKFVWRCSIALSSEDLHFFSRDKDSQVKWLESFLKESIDLAKQIEKLPIPQATT